MAVVPRPGCCPGKKVASNPDPGADGTSTGGGRGWTGVEGLASSCGVGIVGATRGDGCEDCGDAFDGTPPSTKSDFVFGGFSEPREANLLDGRAATIPRPSASSSARLMLIAFLAADM